MFNEFCVDMVATLLLVNVVELVVVELTLMLEFSEELDPENDEPWFCMYFLKVKLGVSGLNVATPRDLRMASSLLSHSQLMSNSYRTAELAVRSPIIRRSLSPWPQNAVIFLTLHSAFIFDSNDSLTIRPSFRHKCNRFLSCMINKFAFDVSISPTGSDSNGSINSCCLSPSASLLSSTPELDLVKSIAYSHKSLDLQFTVTKLNRSGPSLIAARAVQLVSLRPVWVICRKN